MKKAIVFSAVVLAATFSFTSCEDKNKKADGDIEVVQDSVVTPEPAVIQDSTTTVETTTVTTDSVTEKK